MECRICHQPIGFIRGRFPDRKKTTTLAVHESEMPALLEQGNRVVVAPHPGAQRKLRQDLETHHQGATAAQPERQTTGDEATSTAASDADAAPQGNLTSPDNETADSETHNHAAGHAQPSSMTAAPASESATSPASTAATPEREEEADVEDAELASSERREADRFEAHASAATFKQWR